MCHSIVTKMGGEISVTSKEGGPTIVRVVLPPSDAARDVTVDDSDPAPQLSCASVLVVDDEPAVGTVIRRVLKDHEVTAVTTAREALELLESGKSYQIIFSDLMMPEMSGMEFFKEVTRRFGSTAERVVFVTGGAFTPKAHAFLDHVPNEVLEKPFTPDAVRELVQRYACRI
jgi:CheY-like chemotaxis protein